MQIDFEKKLLPFLQSLSLKGLAISIAGSFALASSISMVSAFLLLPDNSRPRRATPPQSRWADEGKGLSPEEEKQVLARNIFNSEGALGDQAPIDNAGKKKGAAGDLVKSDLPFKVKGLIFSGDPFNGLALLENTQKRRTLSYVVGDTLAGGATLAEIYDDRIIINRSGQKEYLELDKFELERSRRKQSKKTSRGGIAKISTAPPPDAFKENGFERKGMEIKLTEEYKRNLLSPENMTKMLQDAKAEPNMVNGQLRGFRLTRIREDSIYLKAGFQNEDIVEEINGIPLRDAAGAIRLLQQLRSAKEIEVRVNRGGSSSDMNITIQ